MAPVKAFGHRLLPYLDNFECRSRTAVAQRFGAVIASLGFS